MKWKKKERNKMSEEDIKQPEKPIIEMKGTIEYMQLIQVLSELVGSLKPMDFHQCGKCGLTEEDCGIVNCDECVQKKLYVSGATSMASNVLNILTRICNPQQAVPEEAGKKKVISKQAQDKLARAEKKE